MLHFQPELIDLLPAAVAFTIVGLTMLCCGRTAPKPQKHYDDKVEDLIASGSIKGSGHGTFTRGGVRVHPSEMLLAPGKLLLDRGITSTETGATGRLARVRSASYTHDSQTVQLSLDNERGRFEALMARLDAVQGQIR